MGLCVVLVYKTLLRDRIIDSGPLMSSDGGSEVGLHMTISREKNTDFAVRHI